MATPTLTAIGPRPLTVEDIARLKRKSSEKTKQLRAINRAIVIANSNRDRAQARAAALQAEVDSLTVRLHISELQRQTLIEREAGRR